MNSRSQAVRMPKRITILCAIGVFLTPFALRTWLYTETQQPHPRVLLSLIKLTNTTASSPRGTAIISASNRSDRPIEVTISAPDLPSFFSTNRTDNTPIPLSLAFGMSLIQTHIPTNSIGPHSAKTLRLPSPQFFHGPNPSYNPTNPEGPNNAKTTLLPSAPTNSLQIMVDWREKMTPAETLLQNTKSWLNRHQSWHLFSIEKKPIKHIVQELVTESKPEIILEPYNEKSEPPDFSD
jgi:hypothetical protein